MKKLIATVCPGNIVLMANESYRNGFAHIQRINNKHLVSICSDENWPLLVEIAASMVSAEGRCVQLSIE